MKRKYFKPILALLIILPLALTACGSSSDKEVAATNFPYGADSYLTSESNDDYSTQVTYEYNQAMQVIGYTTVEEEHGDIDGNDGVVYREITITTVDPSITANYDIVAKVAKKSISRFDGFGAITSLIESRFEINEETGILDTTPYRKSEYRYSYNNSGQLLENIRFSTREMETTTYTYSYSYNSAGDLTKEEYTKDYPASINSSYSEITTIEYDSHGNQSSNTYTQEGDQDGDGTDDATVQNMTTYINSYENNLLSQTITTINNDGSDEETYQIDYSYNTQGQLVSSTKSTNQYGDDDTYDTFTVHTYTYDSADRLLSDSQEDSYYSNDDEIIDSLSRTNLVWEYNQDGLLVMNYHENINYSDPADETLSSHDKYEYTYQYTNSGNVSQRTYERRQDFNLDGEFERITYDWSYDYTYNDTNYLSAYTRVSHNYTDGEISSSNTYEQTFTYSDGVLTEAELTETDSYNEEPSSSLTRLSYDDSGKFIRYEAQHNNGTEIIDLTYNNNQIVTFLFQSDDEEYMTMDVDFSTEGLPSGTADFAIESLTIYYPNTPGNNDSINDLANSISSETDENDKVYPFNIKIPKMMMFIYNSEIADK